MMKYLAAFKRWVLREETKLEHIVAPLANLKADLEAFAMRANTKAAALYVEAHALRTKAADKVEASEAANDAAEGARKVADKLHALVS